MISVIRDLISGDADFLFLVTYVAASAFVVFCSLSLHEFAHAFTAVKLGDDTPLLRGRLTISPMAHISPLGALFILLFGFGYAKPVEVRMRKFKNPKRDMAIVAVAGPICNLIQAVVFMFIYNLLRYNLSPENSVSSYIVYFFLSIAYSNVSLAVFNLLPIPPLDGSRLLNAFLPSKYYYKIMQYERYISIALIILVVTGILTTPLSILSSLLINLIGTVTELPFV